MNGGDLTFHSEVDRILEEFERRRREDEAERAQTKEEWRRSVHDFREVARRVIVPTLREIKEPLRARGLRPYISNNTRQGLNIWLEVDAERLKPILLVFRLDAERRTVEVEGLTQDGPERRETSIEGCDRRFVEAAVVSFLRQLPSVSRSR
jgi:hypothetical protein